MRFVTDSLSRDVPWTAGTQKALPSLTMNLMERLRIPGILASRYNLQGERKQVCFPPQKLQESSKHQAISCHQITHCNQALHPAACAPASHAWDHRHSFGICPKAQINGPTRRGCWIVQTGDGNSTNMLSRFKLISGHGSAARIYFDESHFFHFTRGQNNVLP